MVDTLGEIIRGLLNGDTQSLSLIAAVYIFLVCSYSVFYQNRMSRWPTVCGKLQHAGIEVLGAREQVLAEQDYLARALYSYEVDGAVYEGNRISSWVIVASHNVQFVLQRQLKRVALGAADEVAVYYNPRNPANSVRIKPGPIGQIITAMLALAPVAAYGVKYGTQI